MKKIITQFAILLPMLLLAGIAGATYGNPTAVPTNGNTGGPITVSSTDQVKNGNLSVGIFHARNNSWLQQKSFMSGLVRGGEPADVTSTISFGSSTHDVSLDFNKDVSVDGVIQSDSLAGSGESRVCADVNGKLFRCTLSTLIRRVSLDLLHTNDDTDNDPGCSSTRIRNTATATEYYVDALNGGGMGCGPASTLGYVDVPSGTYTILTATISPQTSGSATCSLSYWLENYGMTPYTAGNTIYINNNFYITGTCN